MSTQKETILYILEMLHTDVGHRKSNMFSARAMFGEYALYCDKKVVALVCDDLLYIKITPESFLLEKLCEKDAPYDGARLYYLVEEEQLQTIENLADILHNVAKALPSPRPKKTKGHPL